jgi:hypothetical protein
VEVLQQEFRYRAHSLMPQEKLDILTLFLLSAIYFLQYKFLVYVGTRLQNFGTTKITSFSKF